MMLVQDLTFLLNKHLSTYDNVAVMGDFNIDVKVLKKSILPAKPLAYKIWSRVTLVTLKLTSHL